MAQDVTKIVVGAITSIEIAPYVASKGAGTFQDAGFTLDGYTFEEKAEFHETVPDQRLGVVKRERKAAGYEFKTSLAQAELENYRLALGIPTADLTGTPPNLTLKSNLSRKAQPYQCRIKEPGLGTTGVRTKTMWAVDLQCGAIPSAKDSEQKLPLTGMGREETTGAGTDSYMIVDS
jgi:hypothetical protein